MPQMAPLMWFYMLLSFLTVLIFISIYIYFQMNMKLSQKSINNKMTLNTNWKW